MGRAGGASAARFHPTGQQSGRDYNPALSNRREQRLLIGHPGAGQCSAIRYSLLVSRQRYGNDLLAYLRNLLTRLPRLINQDDLAPLTRPAGSRPAQGSGASLVIITTPR